MMRKFIKLVGLILSIAILSSCSAYKSLYIGDISNVNFKGMVNNKISLELKVPVTNPNGYKIKIKSMDLDLTINGDYIGKMKSSNLIVIPARSNELQTLPVDIYVRNPLASMSLIYKMRKAKSFEMEIKGTIKVKALLKAKTIEVSEKQNVSI